MTDWGRSIPAPSTEWEHVQTQVMPTQSAVISFTGIDTTYRRFQLYVSGVVPLDVGDNPKLTLNNDSIPGGYRDQSVGLYLFPNGGALSQAFGYTGSAFVFSLPVTPSSAMAALITITKPAAAMNARITAKSSARSSSQPSVAGNFEGGWANIQNLINRIDLIFTWGIGSRVMLAAARES